MTAKLTWTVGVRMAHNSNPLNPHLALARLPASFDAITHDPNQPLSDLIQTHLGNLFDATAAAYLGSLARRWRGRFGAGRYCGAALVCSAICCLGVWRI